jgi:hypothetical protein
LFGELNCNFVSRDLIVCLGLFDSACRVRCSENGMHNSYMFIIIILNHNSNNGRKPDAGTNTTEESARIRAAVHDLIKATSHYICLGFQFQSKSKPAKSNNCDWLNIVADRHVVDRHDLCCC